MIYNFGVTISQLQLILQLIITSTKHEANLTGNCQKYLVVTPLATGKKPNCNPTCNLYAQIKMQPNDVELD
jgi:hypothetical protein